MWRTIKTQVQIIFRRKSAAFLFLALLVLVLYNFLSNVKTNSEIIYVTQMFQTEKVLTLSDWTPAGYYLMLYFPILVVLPTCCDYLNDRNTKMLVYVQSRSGKRKYWYGKILAVFISTLLIFTIPFLLELLISLLCFSKDALGDPSMQDYIASTEKDRKIFLFSLFVSNPACYYALMTLFFGISSAILAVFNYAVVMLFSFRFKIFAFFPLYLLMYVIRILSDTFHVSFETDYFFIMRLYNEDSINKSYILYFVFLCMLVLFALICTEIKVRKDEII